MKKTALLIASALLVLGFISAAPHIYAQEQKRPVYVLEMEGAVGPAYTDYLRRGLHKAGENNAQLVVLELNTPGGLLTSTRDMVSEILNSPIPVAVWVTPSGAHAASAGTFLLYAAHIAAMDEGTNVGAATPIELGREQDKNREQEQQEQGSSKSEKDPLALPSSPGSAGAKAIEDTSAFIRSLAEIRGRNADWAEKAVTKADSLTAREALEKNVTDHLATNLNDLLEQIHGKTIEVKNAPPVTLQLQEPDIKRYEPDARTKFLAYITDPNVAFILMTIGIYGLILEFYNPGTMIPGTIGAICLLIGLFALNILPVNAAGLALIVLAVLLIVAEAFVPSFGILGLGGIAAFIVGAAIMFDTSGMPGMALDWQIIAGTGLFGLMLVGLVVWLTVHVYRKKISTGPESMVGEQAYVIRWKDTEGRVMIRGEIWKAYSDDTLDLKKDDKVTISKIDGLALKIIPQR